MMVDGRNERFKWGTHKDMDHHEDQDVDGSIILNYVLKKQVSGERKGIILLRTGTNGGLL